MKAAPGTTWGRLTVVAYHHAKSATVRCVCGTEKIVMPGNLYTGNTTSCGCLHREQLAEGNRQNSWGLTHGMSGERSYVYETWRGIKRRCHNPNHPMYEYYGGRGIEVCIEWREDFAAFSDYLTRVLGERPIGYSIDRIDNDLGYQPGNVRWASSGEQAANRRPRGPNRSE